MTRCNRFEREGLVAIERGETLDAHFDSCEDCRQARESYRELTRDIRATATTLAPPDDFQARVLAEIERRQRRARHRRWMGGAAAAVAVAAAIALLWRGDGAPRTQPRVALEQSIESSGRAVRGVSAKPGDVLVLRAEVGDEPAELRVYGEAGGLVLRCTEAPPCARAGGRLGARVELSVRGDYRAVVVVGDAGSPTGELGADVAALEAAGATVVIGESVQVR